MGYVRIGHRSPATTEKRYNRGQIVRTTRKLNAALMLIACTLRLCGQSAVNSVCVAPNGAEEPQTCAPGLCAPGPLALKFDQRSLHDWPKAQSPKVDDLELNQRHRVTIYRAGKPQQSFTFRFADYKSPRLCLFLNDMYWTAQLWEANQAPWCKCW